MALEEAFAGLPTKLTELGTPISKMYVAYGPPLDSKLENAFLQGKIAPEDYYLGECIFGMGVVKSPCGVNNTALVKSSSVLRYVALDESAKGQDLCIRSVYVLPEKNETAVILEVYNFLANIFYKDSPLMNTVRIKEYFEGCGVKVKMLKCEPEPY